MPQKTHSKLESPIVKILLYLVKKNHKTCEQLSGNAV